MSARHQQGVALVIALALVVILTLLATTAVRMSVAELVMAGNEQFRHRASTAASAGIEVAIARLAGGGGEGEATGDGFIASIRYTGMESPLPGSSAEKFVGRHFEIRSTGTAARHARDEQVQGVMIISAANLVKTFGPLEAVP